jgi:hypothetical protein
MLLLMVLTAGRIAGTIEYVGPPVSPAAISRSDPQCKVKLSDPTVTLSKSGRALANVVVRVVKGAPEVAPPSGAVVVRQQDCMYAPHVQGAVKGQRIVVKNTDGTMHNVHAFIGLDDKKTLFNVAQPPGAKDVDKDSSATVGVVKMKCDVHPWMRAYVLFNDNAFFAVSDEDGRYALEGLPPGPYALEAWHEKLGTLTAEVVVEEGKAVDPRLSFSAH